jgi:uncharacterized membrane protein
VENSGKRGPRDGLPALPPWQFLMRAAAVVTGLTLLLIVNVHGTAFYIAWSLIVLALISETVATAVYWTQSRNGRT